MTFTLISDGRSDAVLVPILTWSLKRRNVTSIREQMPDWSRMPRRGSEDFIKQVLDLYPCDLLFYHRDAEAQDPVVRRKEIASLLDGCAVRHIPVVPVRMTEAWLLADEKAIRSAAGNPNGATELDLPLPGKLEELPNPKAVLHKALVEASGLNAHRRSGFPVNKRVHRIPDFIDDFSMLDALPAFQALQNDIQDALTELQQMGRL